MSTKNEYLYQLGTGIILGSQTRLNDAIDIVNDYSETIDSALESGLSFDEVQAKIDSPKQIVSALHGEKILKFRYRLIAPTLFLFFFFLWGTTLIYNFGHLGRQTLLVNDFVLMITIIGMSVVTWVILRNGALSFFLPLKEPRIIKPTSLFILHLVPLCSVAIFYPIFYYVIYYTGNWTQEQMSQVGPAIVKLIYLLFLINMTIACYGVFLVLHRSSIYSSLFPHIFGSMGCLLLFLKTMQQLADLNDFWILFSTCHFTYFLGLILAIIMLFATYAYHRKGRALWMHR